MHGLIRTVGMFPGHVTVPMVLSVSIWLTFMATACAPESVPPTKPQSWKISEFQYLSDGSPCCPGPLGPALGIVASTDRAMPQNSMKLAVGCRAQPGGTEFGAVVEMRVRDGQGRLETFEALDLVTAGACDEADMAWGLATFRAVRQAATVWGVTVTMDVELCGLISDGRTNRSVLMRALEEAAVRKNCHLEVQRLATSTDEELALRAVGTLGRIGSTESIPTLGGLTLSNNPGMPWAATHAIADIGGPEAARALEIIAAQANTVELRVEAEKLAGTIRDAR